MCFYWWPFSWKLEAIFGSNGSFYPRGFFNQIFHRGPEVISKIKILICDSIQSWKPTPQGEATNWILLLPTPVYNLGMKFQSEESLSWNLFSSAKAEWVHMNTSNPKNIDSTMKELHSQIFHIFWPGKLCSYNVANWLKLNRSVHLLEL